MVFPRAELPPQNHENATTPPPPRPRQYHNPPPGQGIPRPPSPPGPREYHEPPPPHLQISAPPCMGGGVVVFPWPQGTSARGNTTSPAPWFSRVSVDLGARPLHFPCVSVGSPGPSTCEQHLLGPRHLPRLH